MRDDALIAFRRRPVALINDKVRDRLHCLAAVRAPERLDAAEDETARPVVALGLHHGGGKTGDLADGGKVLLYELVRVLEHKDAGVTVGFCLLPDVEACYGGLAGTRWQYENGVAVSIGLGAGRGHGFLLIVPRDHVRALPQRAQKGALPPRAEEGAAGPAGTGACGAEP